MSLQQIADFFRDKRVLILGFGREGRSTLEGIRAFLPEQEITIADANAVHVEDPHVRLRCGEGYLDGINDFDVVMKSPGISVRDVAIAPQTLVTCQTDLFLRYSDCKKTVGITGTKGKTTTSSLIYAILQAAGVKSSLIGNIGVPVFECLKDTQGMTAVIEMSSHQLEFCRHSPDIALLTNLYPEHLDHYNGFAGYVNAKLNIARYQTAGDLFLINGDQDVSAIARLDGFPGRLERIRLAEQQGAFERELLACNPHLRGEHFHYDILFALHAARDLGIGEDAIRRGIADFQGAPHRLEFVGEYGGIKWYDDAIATIPRAVECGVQALGDVDTLIIGGMDRGLDYGEFEAYLCAAPVRNLVCLPDTGHAIGRRVQERGAGLTVRIAQGMEQAVRIAAQVTRPGRSCLLSPAASSYNVYRNFEEKGGDFQRCVRALGSKSHGI